ncbi:hypothetical protein [Haloplanus aerogenes]|uniref:Uncharacterized protein n=1 Tax=Haloplanus aerogenes TaxID=660522 RepID=A0A3M0DCX7_9EURY|nr:hypothetical protein [Haloplanus aerogenes]AZH25228.1 hypothetical protein DU502_07460 [Haloplanus aerogenes]RMB13543.1 hypothetical protein ATH50_1982 [Haloplanus aerogenes]
MSIPVYSTITVAEVTFEEDTDPVDIDPAVHPEFAREGDPAEPAFVVGIHASDPAVGLEPGPESLESLIGYKLLEPGTHTDVTVPIFPTQFTRLDEGQTFPPAPDDDAVITGAIWADFESEEPVVSGEMATISGGMNQVAALLDLLSFFDVDFDCETLADLFEFFPGFLNHPNDQCVFVYDPLGTCPPETSPDEVLDGQYWCALCCAE